ncbi:hypothetical protein EOM09_07140 [bacterium]|nr:hypothetical protein [bacterium]
MISKKCELKESTKYTYLYIEKQSKLLNSLEHFKKFSNQTIKEIKQFIEENNDNYILGTLKDNFGNYLGWIEIYRNKQDILIISLEDDLKYSGGYLVYDDNYQIFKFYNEYDFNVHFRKE